MPKVALTSTLKPRAIKPELDGIGNLLTPLFDSVFVERFEVGDEVGKDKLIVIPDAYKGRAIMGRVFAAGLGAFDTNDSTKRIPLEVKVGDNVMFGAWAGKEMQFEHNGKMLEFVALKECEVLALVSLE
jgi:chaperonin GroES